MNEAATLELAEARLRHGDAAAAIDLLKRLLGDDPSSSAAHAVLAHALLQQRRIHAARLEAQAALELAPESKLAHLVAASVAMAHREFGRAEEYLGAAMALHPEAAEPRLVLARLRLLQGDVRAARQSALEALELEPDELDARVLLGELALQERRYQEAEEQAKDVLSAEPEHAEGLCLMGHVLLARGDVDAARDHAIWALRNGEPRSALELLVAIKARQSFWLGLWWRYTVWLSSLGSGRAIVVLIVAYVVQRAASIAALQAGRAGLSQMIGYAWLGICVYTWIAPVQFRRALDRELGKVALKDDF